jgi:hypothetical protein
VLDARGGLVGGRVLALEALLRRLLPRSCSFVSAWTCANADFNCCSA